MNRWHLYNLRKQKGMLGDAKRFIGEYSKHVAATVSVQLESDRERVMHYAPKLFSEAVRSFEMWWDGERKELMMVIAAVPGDLALYQKAFSNMYPGAQYAALKDNTPEWFDRRTPYKFFDVGVYHGHYASLFRQDDAPPWMMSNLASTIQQGRFAWIQFAFCRYDFTAFLQRHLQGINGFHADIRTNKPPGSSFLDGLMPDVSGGNKTDAPPTAHPESGGEFHNNFSALQHDAIEKARGPHGIVSVRGLIDAGTTSDINVADAISFGEIRSNHDFLTPYTYPASRFFSHDMDKAEQQKTKWQSLLALAGFQFDGIRIGREKTKRQRIEIYQSRAIPDPREKMNRVVGRYASKGMIGGYRPRQSPPFNIVLQSEMPSFVHLPDSSTPNLRVTRYNVLPSQQLDKRGFSIGRLSQQDSFDGAEYYARFGREHVSSDIDAVTVSPADFARHMYLPGGTGSGKSSVIRVIAKHLEMTNIYASLPREVPVSEIRGGARTRKMLSGLDRAKTLADQDVGWPNAFIYFDPKGDDSEMFIRQCEKITVERNLVHYMDPSRTNFSINPLELPPYDRDKEGARDELVALYVGYFFEMIKGWYGNSEAFVRMNRIMRNLLEYIYLNNDKPTFIDLYDLILKIQERKKKYLQVMYRSLGRPSEELNAALKSIAAMDARSFEPVLNRLDIFAVSAKMKHMFCQRRSTALFSEMIKPGHYTVVRFSESDIPMNVINLVMQTFVLKLWFEILHRSSTTPLGERTQVVLALDEFQKMKGISVLETMISQARSKGLGLILAHQSLKQLDESDLSSITTNFGIQMAGHLEGNDAQRLASAWDPKYVNDIKNMIATQPVYRWTARIAPKPGGEQPLPVQFWTHFDPESGQACRPNMTREEWNGFVASERERYGTRDGDTHPLVDVRLEERNRWMENMDAEFLSRERWHLLLLLLRKGPLNLKEVTSRYNPTGASVAGTTPRDTVSCLLREMVHDGLLAPRTGRLDPYAVAEETRKEYFGFDCGAVGTAQDIPELFEKAVAHYLDRGCFVAVASQRIHEAVDKTDLVAYDYSTDTPISIELESGSECVSHLEHVRYNMTKWPKLGFKECHVWSFSEDIRKGHGALDEELKRGVKIFVVRPDPNTQETNVPGAAAAKEGQQQQDTGSQSAGPR